MGTDRPHAAASTTAAQAAALAAFLDTRRADLLAAAEERVLRAGLPHYDAAHRQDTVDRLERLLDVVINTCRDRRADHVLGHADALVEARLATGVELREVQTAVNILEETLWHSITEHVAVTEQPLALGLVSTVLGAIKDRVAQDYLSHTVGEFPSLPRIDLLFAGCEGNVSIGLR
jgi:hypothetical protein